MTLEAWRDAALVLLAIEGFLLLLPLYRVFRLAHRSLRRIRRVLKPTLTTTRRVAQRVELVTRRASGPVTRLSGLVRRRAAGILGD